ncbi:NAD-binding protein [Fomitiporia mediterranea MF3/22]|uniref:NAD-binding protein n=1 Tax=Fomitiporia mediterranea (strain MF3/22) TaxID=694068 RepID=UPI0004407F9E|nr:NAD-binding protein [Fomitiporia mediterranea MF3/22]EJD01504.1 NAD-binding protein [Fomitiporia mediterranea MF3/22]
MSAAKPFVLHWGIIGAGGISSRFVEDLVLHPEGRGTTDVAHAVAAVGSRSLDKAQEFIQKYCPEGGFAQKAGLTSTKSVARGSYAEVYSDPNVDIIYVGTPHSCHFEDAKNALDAGKHVLLEKPATLNQAEFEVLSKLAKSKNLFLMEAVWTRFFPLTFALEDVLFKQEAIGEIRRLQSDFSIDFIDVLDNESHRMLNINLAGGGLLDLGPYPLVWALLLLYNHPQNGRTPPTNIKASMEKYKTGVDLHTNWTLDFPRIGKTGARAVLSTSINVNSPLDVVTRIQGTKGEILLPWATARPDRFTIRRSKVGRGPQEYTEEIKVIPIQGMGLNWEADAVARDIRDGKIENARMPHADTLLELAIFDEVRRQGGYVFPEGMEKVKLST